jgi:hypothetical protein
MNYAERRINNEMEAIREESLIFENLPQVYEAPEQGGLLRVTGSFVKAYVARLKELFQLLPGCGIPGPISALEIVRRVCKRFFRTFWSTMR